MRHRPRPLDRIASRTICGECGGELLRIETGSPFRSVEKLPSVHWRHEKGAFG